MSHHPRVTVVAASLDILGGQGVQAQSLLEALVRDGYDVRLLPINPRFPRWLEWLRRVPYARTVANQTIYLPSLTALLDTDVVHVFSASYASFLLAPLPAMLVARAFHKRVVLHYHSGEADDHLAKWGPLVHPWLKLADEIVVPSTYLWAVFARYGYATRVIPNVVDLSRFSYRARQPLRPRLLSTRNLEQYYRVDVILKAFALIKAQRPDATLTVAGYGSQEAFLRSLAVDGVRFVGKVAPDRMAALYAESDIFLNTSVVDNQPVSILEALASGLPTVSTPAGDIPAMISHRQTGLLVPHDSPASLASGVLGLLASPDIAAAMAERAHHTVRRHTWSAVRDLWAAAYTGDGTTTPADANSARDTGSWTTPHPTR